MARQYLVGLDIGTSGSKCIMTDQAGNVIASATEEYPLHTPKPGWAEQDPADWWMAVRKGCAALIKKAGVPTDQIAGLSLSGQMHGLVALDTSRKVIRPAILWCDQRTQKQCDRLTEKAGGPDALLAFTNNQMLTGYTGGKLLWLQEEEPWNYEKMDVFCCPKDYIRFLLTGLVATDVSDGSGTGLFDVKNRVWNDELISLSGLNRFVFPHALESTECAGRITKEAAEATGLPEGLKVFAGGGDAVIQSVGAGLVKPGIMGVVIGTAGNVACGLQNFERNPQGKLQVFCSNEPGLWTALGCTLSAGGSLRWYRDCLCEDDKEKARLTGRSVYELTDEKAAASVPGSHGVIFLPYLSGERCPYPDPDCRGIFYGLTLATTRGDMTRAVMEGVTYSLKQLINLLGVMSPSEKVYTSGGGARSKLWRQMQADIFDLPVYTMSAAGEGGAYGAVMVAGVGAGVFRNLNEAIAGLKCETETMPDIRNQQAYRNNFSLYSDLYNVLKPTFDKAARLDM